MAKKSGEIVAAAPEAASEPKPGLALVLPFDVTTNLTLAGLSAGFDKTKPEEMANMAIKTAEDFVAFNQGNLEAVVKSGQIWAAGLQDLSKSLAAAAQAQIEETLANVKALASVKSFKEAVDLQTTLAKASLEKAMAETSKLTDASLKLAEQTWAPLTDRVNLAVEKFGRAA